MHQIRHILVAVACVLAASLTGCGGSSGAGSGAIGPIPDDGYSYPPPNSGTAKTPSPSTGATLPSNPNPGTSVDSGTGSAPLPETVSTLPVYQANPAFRLTGFDKVHDQGIRGEGVTVAVVDTGVAPHGKLGERLVAGIDVTGESPDGRRDVDGHGTHIAGIIAAAIEGNGMVGIAPKAKIAPIRIFNDQGFGSAADLKAAMLASGGLNAKIYNWSLGSMVSNTDFVDALNWARDNDKLVMAASGNFGWSAPAWPAGYANLYGGHLIAVGAIDENGQLASYSNAAGATKNYFLVAPGTGIVSLAPGGGTDVKTGTSMATGVVSGVAALVWGHWPYLKATDVANILFDTATDLGAPGVDDVYGRGLVNAQRALQPVGTMSTPTVNGGSISENEPLARLPAGVALAQAGEQKVVYFDHYRRAYETTLDKTVVGQGTSRMTSETLRDEVAEAQAQDVRGELGAGLALAGYWSRAEGTPALRWSLSSSNGFKMHEGVRYLDHRWRGLPQFSSLRTARGVGFERALGGGFSAGVLHLQAEDRTGTTQQGWAATLSRDFEHQRLSLTSGKTHASLGLGESGFVSLRWEASLDANWRAHAQLNTQLHRQFNALGRTNMKAHSLALGLEGSSVWHNNDRLTLSLSLPSVRARGQAHWTLATGVNEDGTPRFESVSLPLRQTGQEKQLKLTYATAPFKGRQWLASTQLRVQPGNNAAASPELALSVQLRQSF
jgi:hypothetical protein